MTVTEMPPIDHTPDAPAAAAGKKGNGKKGKKDKGGRSNLLPAVVLAAGIAAGGWFMGGSGGGAAASTDTTAEAAVVEGPLLGMEPLTVNLAGGHYLRVAVSLQLSDAYEDVVEDHEGGEALAHHDETRVRDALISLFGGRDAGELSTSDGRDAARHDLHAATSELLDGTVMEVYFTEFVIQ